MTQQPLLCSVLAPQRGREKGGYNLKCHVFVQKGHEFEPQVLGRGRIAPKSHRKETSRTPQIRSSKCHTLYMLVKEFVCCLVIAMGTLSAFCKIPRPPLHLLSPGNVINGGTDSLPLMIHHPAKRAWRLQSQIPFVSHSLSRKLAKCIFQAHLPTQLCLLLHFFTHQISG